MSVTRKTVQHISLPIVTFCSRLLPLVKMFKKRAFLHILLYDTRVGATD